MPVPTRIIAERLGISQRAVLRRAKDRGLVPRMEGRVAFWDAKQAAKIARELPRYRFPKGDGRGM